MSRAELARRLGVSRARVTQRPDLRDSMSGSREPEAPVDHREKRVVPESKMRGHLPGREG